MSLEKQVSLVGAVLVGLVALSCGGGGSSATRTSPKHPPPFSVNKMDPAPGTNGVANNAKITLYFDGAVDASSVSPSTVYVTAGSSGPVQPGDLTVSPDGLRVTYVPNPWLDVSTSYTIHAEKLVSAQGDALSSPFAGSYLTAPWASPKPVTQGQFDVLANHMVSSRSSHTSTLLQNGYVLLTGGYTSGTNVTASAELFDPNRTVFLPTAGDMSSPRANHTATLLPSGLVLVCGGEQATDGTAVSSVDLYSPAATTFVPTARMSVPRAYHTATLLMDGRVLVTGGRTVDAGGNVVYYRSAELYDPHTETWTPTKNDMAKERAGHRATLLPDGRVLITGGSGENTAEIFDPTTDSFSTIASPMTAVRSLHGTVVLPNGNVFITDGGSQTGEIFNPSTETFTPTGDADSAIRSAAVTFQYEPGQVLVVGGIDFGASFLNSSVEQFDAAYGDDGRYFSVPPLPGTGVYLADPRAYSAVSKLADGRFLVTGGLGPSYYGPDLDTAFIFDPSAK